MIEAKPLDIAPVQVPVAPPPPKTVKVELVWPESRGAKNDCCGGTNVVWSGHGDVQDYPAELWTRLASHPDVWRLVNPADASAAASATRTVTENPLQRVERLNLARQAQIQAASVRSDAARREAERAAAERARELGASTNTDVVQLAVSTTLDAEQLAEMSDADIHAEAVKRGYALHPRLNPVNLRARFLESQDGPALKSQVAASG